MVLKDVGSFLGYVPSSFCFLGPTESSHLLAYVTGQHLLLEPLLVVLLAVIGANSSQRGKDTSLSYLSYRNLTEECIRKHRISECAS